MGSKDKTLISFERILTRAINCPTSEMHHRTWKSLDGKGKNLGKPAKIFKMIRNGWPSSFWCHQTCLSLDDKDVDNHEVYPRATGPLSLTNSKMILFRSLGRKTLTSPEKVQMMTLVTACYRALSVTDSKWDFFTVSAGRRWHLREGADDDVSHCMLPGFESYE